MPMQVEAQPQKNRKPITGKKRLSPSSHVLLDETRTESIAEHLSPALQAIHDQQGLLFRDGLCYMTLLSLVSYALEH